MDYNKVLELIKDKMDDRENVEGIDISTEYEVLGEDILQSIQKARKPDGWVKHLLCPWFSVEIKQRMVQMGMHTEDFYY